MVSDLRLFVRADNVRIVVDAGQAAPLATALARYAIMDDFAAAPVPELLLLAVGPGGARAAGGSGRRRRRAGDGPAAGTRPAGRFWIARVREFGAEGFWIGGPPTDAASFRGKLASDVPELDATVAEAARIDALEPRFGAEITADYFPMEVGLAGAIDYTKGCYLGQEPIVRVRDRGHINWRLVGLDVAGADDPHPGDLLASEAKPKAGRVTSAARLPNGRGVALAMAHVSLPVGATVHIGAGAIEARIRADVA